MNINTSIWPDILPRAGNEKLERLDSVSPWFGIYRVSDGVFALLEPKHREETISYLILGRERAVLLDTGMGISDIRVEVERLTQLPVTVVVTHGHYDHIGDNHRYKEIWAFDSDIDVGRIEQGKTRQACAHYLTPDAYLELPPEFDPDTYQILPSKVTRRLQHLEVIDLGGRKLTVHHTPGHTSGSICLLESRDHLLFTGDTLYTGMMFAHFEDSDFNQYRESIQYLVDLMPQVNHLCPSHNEAYVPKLFLLQLQEAFQQVADDTAPFDTDGNNRIYRFDGFGLMVPVP